jgi:hypothetical protein
MNNPDSRRGKAPEIRFEEDRVSFLLKIDLPRGVKGQLLLRCDQDGEIQAAIVSAVIKERR